MNSNWSHKAKHSSEKLTLLKVILTINVIWVSGCLVHVQWCQKIKQEVRSPFPCKFSVDKFVLTDYICQSSNWLQQQFLDQNASVKISIFQNLFNWAVEELLSYLQLEVINLQSNDMLKDKYQPKNLTELYKCLSSSQYAQLKLYASELITVFGGTFLYEKTFSKTHYSFLNWNSAVKSHCRSVLTNEHQQWWLNDMFIPQKEFFSSNCRPIQKIALYAYYQKKVTELLLCFKFVSKKCVEICFFLFI